MMQSVVSTIAVLKARPGAGTPLLWLVEMWWRAGTHSPGSIQHSTGRGRGSQSEREGGRQPYSTAGR
jgi:hypothetical protein